MLSHTFIRVLPCTLNLIFIEVAPKKMIFLFFYTRFLAAAHRNKFESMRPSLQRWLRQGLYLVKSCKNIADFVSYITNQEVQYGHGSLKCEVLNEQIDDYCAAFYSPEIIKAIQKTTQVAFDIGVDATFNILPKIFFPKKTRKKQFVTVMIKYRTQVP